MSGGGGCYIIKKNLLKGQIGENRNSKPSTQYLTQMWTGEV